MFFYPASGLVIANEALALTGLIEVVPPEAPLALLIWSASRVVPVRITQITVNEEAYDQALNPIQAKVSLSLRVLNYDDLGLLSVGGGLFMVHQVAKEVMANIGSVGSFSATANVGIG